MRWAIFRGKGYLKPFMAEPGTPYAVWTDKLEGIYWFDSAEAAEFRAVVKKWKLMREDAVLSLLVAWEITPED